VIKGASKATTPGIRTKVRKFMIEKAHHSIQSDAQVFVKCDGNTYRDRLVWSHESAGACTWGNHVRLTKIGGHSLLVLALKSHMYKPSSERATDLWTVSSAGMSAAKVVDGGCSLI
jgi:hypothetical protein